MKDHRKHRVATPRHYKVVKALLAGESIAQALLSNGYSKSTARLGMRGIPKTALALMPKDSNLVTLGDITADQQETITRGRLVYNVLTGSDKGVMSAKALGSDRRVNMFVPDSQTGLIVLNMPKEVSELSQDAKKQLIEGEE